MRYSLSNPKWWRPVIVPDKGLDYTGLYEVHASGKVREIATGKIFRGIKHPLGYRQVSLTDATGKRKRHTIHRIVGFAWVKNPKPGKFKIINHKDGIKHNNLKDNLEWCNNSKNILHARAMGLNPYNKPTIGKKFGTNSIYHGVGFDRAKWKWFSYVRHNNKEWYRKRFSCEIEAALHFNWICDELNLIDRPRNVIVNEKPWRLRLPNGRTILCTGRGVRIKTLEF